MEKRGIIEDFNKRNPKSIEGIYDNYYKALVIYSMSFNNEKMQAEDSVQDSIITLWHSDIKFESEDNLRNYLYNSVRNKSINVIRHLKIRSAYVDNFDEELEPNEEERLIKQEYHRILFNAVKNLDWDKQKIIEMNLLQENKLIDIAKSMKISYRTSKRKKDLAIRELRRIVKDFL